MQYGITVEILTGLKNAAVSLEDLSKYMSWTQRIAGRRIDQIVSNKHRTAYRRAAEVLGALAESYLLMGESGKSRAVVRKYRDEKYNRHSAFRREVNAVIAKSGILDW